MKRPPKLGMKNYIVSDRLLPAFPLGALATSLLLVTAAVRMPVASLRAADQNAGPRLMGQPQADADRKSAGCISCHTQTDEATMHATGTVRLGCTDCHGGNSEIHIESDITAGSPKYDQAKRQAHPQPRDPELANRSATPVP